MVSRNEEMGGVRPNPDAQPRARALEGQQLHTQQGDSAQSKHITMSPGAGQRKDDREEGIVKRESRVGFGEWNFYPSALEVKLITRTSSLKTLRTNAWVVMKMLKLRN